MRGILSVGVAVAAILAATPAQAFGLRTHLYIADQVWADVQDDCQVGFSRYSAPRRQQPRARPTTRRRQQAPPQIPSVCDATQTYVYRSIDDRWICCIQSSRWHRHLKLSECSRYVPRRSAARYTAGFRP